LEDEVVNILNTHEIGGVGPNCLGVLNDKINTTFIAKERTIVLDGSEKSPIGLIVQSGGIGLELFEYLGTDRMPVGTWISCGNASSFTISNLVDYVGSDDGIKVVGVYVESVPNGVDFYETLKRVCEKKPVIILKGGRGEHGVIACGTHTGNMTKNTDVFDSCCNQAGAFEAFSVKALANTISILTTQKPPTSRKVAIMAVGGGIGINVTDRSENVGLKLVTFGEETVKRLRQVPGLEKAHIGNPLDILGSATTERLIQVLEILNEDPNVGLIYSLPYFQVPGFDEKEVFKGIGRVNENMVKPLIISPRGDGAYREYCRKELADAGVPTYTDRVIVPLLLAMRIWYQYPGVDFRAV
jgi:acyl-CoA synthetase (NDP forming)